MNEMIEDRMDLTVHAVFKSGYYDYYSGKLDELPRAKPVEQVIKNMIRIVGSRPQVGDFINFEGLQSEDNTKVPAPDGECKVERIHWHTHHKYDRHRLHMFVIVSWTGK